MIAAVDFPDGTRSAWVDAPGWDSTGTATVTFTFSDNTVDSTTLVISEDCFDNRPDGDAILIELPEPLERPKAPPPDVQVVLAPPKRRMALCRPRVSRPRAREGGIGTRNWHNR